MDFVSDQLFDGTRFRALTVVDNFSRRSLAIKAGKSLKGTDMVQVMEEITGQQNAFPTRIKVGHVLFVGRR